MPTKKTTSRSRESLQRSREEQWRRRAAAQGGVVAPTAAPSQTDEAMGVTEGAVEPGSAGRVAATQRSRIQSPVSAQRRASTTASMRSLAATPRGSAKLRMAANSMSVEEEMAYVKSDVMRLTILTVLCLAILIVLAFVIQ